MPERSSSVLKKITAILLVYILLMTLSACTMPGNNGEAATGGSAADDAGDVPKAEKQIFAMDTVMSLTAYGEKAGEAVEAAGKEITRLDRLFSTGDPESDISKLNDAGTLEVSDETYYLIKRAVEIGGDTNGAFDISVFPVMEAWGFTSKEYRVPSDDELSKLTQNVDYSRISFNDDNKEVALGSGMKIDLGGIAKGYTAMRLAELFKEYGVESAIINLGGNAQALGAKPDGSPWRIGIQDPENENGIMGVLEGSDTAVVTSGGYERYFEEDGRTYHHIIDPDTGYPSDNGIVSVTVVTDDGTLADGLSTALFVMGYDRAREYWKKHSNDFDFIIQDKTGTLYVTIGLKDAFSSDLEIVYVD